MKNILVLLLLFIANFCSAQLTFGEHIIADDSQFPQGVTHVELADIDGDGDQDMITASEDDNKIAWFENEDGLGIFGTQNVISLELEEPQIVRLADLDGDGDMDVVSVALFGEEIFAFYNDGNGNFNETILISANNQDLLMVNNLILADVNMNGLIDLVVLSGDRKLLLYTNLDNLGNYSRSVIAETSNIITGDLDVGDIDGDGDLDVVSLSEDMFKLSWHENDNGVFVTHEIDATGINNHFELSDIDGDNDMDLVLGSSFTIDARLSWMEFDGDFSIQHYLTDEDVEVGALDVADVNQDGKEDIILISEDLEEVVWLENLTGGPVKYNYIANTNTFSNVFRVGDFNGDAYPDIILRGDRWHTFLPAENEFSPSSRFETFTNKAYDVVSMDVDEDGDLDIISASNGDGRIGWYENVDGLGDYSQPQILISDDVQDITDIHLADLDGDDDLDIVGSIWNQNVVFWIRNEGEAIFSDTIVIDGDSPKANSVDVGYIDGDGYLDLVVATFGEGFGTDVINNEINWYRNESGLGDFSIPITILENDNRPVEVKLADMDMDQDLDVVCALFGGGVKWIENTDGVGSFGTPVLVSQEGLSLGRLELGDVDGDGDVDILASNFSDTPTLLYLNESGQGEFGDAQVVSQIGSNSMVMSDLDQDGGMDIVAIVVTNFAMDVVWYEQSNDDLSFTSHVISQSPVLDGNNLDVADLDGDGDLDVMSASIADDKIAWYENFDPVSVNDVASLQFTISPVPATTSLLIDSEVELQQVIIYNVEGKLQLMSKDVTNVDVSSLSSGMYIIQVVDVDGQRSAMKFVKE